jgi:DNA invertase Pin-like site-specific DNA recombinase
VVVVLGGQRLCIDSYVRVSRVGGRRGERFISPVVQRGLIEGWAAARGARALEVFEEPTTRGRRADRPLLEQALQRVKGGISDGVVVARVTRFGRSLLSGIAAIERIHLAGGRFVAVSEGLDTGTDTGRLVLGILFSLGEWESERVGVDWDQARATAIARGVSLSAGTPVGYRRTRSGRLRPVPEWAAIVVEAFRRRADGESCASLARWLEALGIRTAYGNVGWTSMSTSKLLAKPHLSRRASPRGPRERARSSAAHGRGDVVRRLSSRGAWGSLTGPSPRCCGGWSAVRGAL